MIPCVSPEHLRIYRDCEIAPHRKNTLRSHIYLQPGGWVYKELCQDDWSYEAVNQNLPFLPEYEELYDIPELVLPECLVEREGRILGYIMPYIEGKPLRELLRDPEVPQNTVVRIFLRLAELINILPEGVCIGDLHEENFMVRGGRVWVIDCDTLKLPGKPQICCPAKRFFESLPLSALEKYGGAEGMRISRESDIFCYFLMLVQWLSGVPDLENWNGEKLLHYIRRLSTLGFPEPCLSLLFRLYQPGENHLEPAAIETLMRCNLRQFQIR